jgi:hypothetical protein
MGESLRPPTMHHRDQEEGIGRHPPRHLTQYDRPGPIIDEREGGEAFQKFSLDLMATRERVLGYSHPDTLESVEQLAIWHENNKECDKALPLYERLEESHSRAHGLDHDESIEASCGIARMLLMQGRLSEARKKQIATYERSLAKYGSEHESTLACAADLSRIARAQGDVQEATRLEQANGELYVARFGEDFHTGVLRQMD